ncbi:4-hydroxythreonine-4-phosphate dehydrogenase PdxA [Thermodesulfobacteriota bacterium B35]
MNDDISMERRSPEPAAHQPPIGITMGCPVGIGPEIILRFFAGRPSFSDHRFVVLGDMGVLRRTAGLLGLQVPLVAWRPGEAVPGGVMPVLDVSHLDPERLRWGRPDSDTGRAMGRCIEEAVRLILAGTLAGMVTCPITKTALNRAGYHFPGHTEMLAHLTESTDFWMMMAGRQLRVVLVTIHEPLIRVPRLLTRARVTGCIRATLASLRGDFGIQEPRLAVAGLNPHAGEDGMFGSEEAEIIAPAVRDGGENGSVSGPWPPDTVFHRAATGGFDAVVAMYHDQGLIPFKLLHFSDGVNVTLGLPIVRTSVDHGTAYDIAGQGVADPSSLAEACRMAALIVANRGRGRAE